MTAFTNTMNAAMSAAANAGAASSCVKTHIALILDAALLASIFVVLICLPALILLLPLLISLLVWLRGPCRLKDPRRLFA